MVAAISFNAASSRAAAIEALEIVGQRAQRRGGRPRRPSSAGSADTFTASPPNSSTSNPSRSRSAARATSACRPAAGTSSRIGVEQPLALQSPAVNPPASARTARARARRAGRRSPHLRRSTAMMKVSRNWPRGIRADAECFLLLSGRLQVPGAGAWCRAPGPEGSGREHRACSLSPEPAGRQRLGYSPPANTPGTGSVSPTGRRWRGGGRQHERGAGPCPSASPKRAPNQFVYQRLLAEPHLRLGRVHVDVHRVERHLDEQVHLGAAVLD